MRQVCLDLIFETDQAHLITDVFVVWMSFAADRLFVRFHV
jgi:hypothetical protein